jgi:hypothetical protein
MDEYLHLERIFIHNLFHFIIPAVAAWILYRNKWSKTFSIMILTMLVDLDHLLADPIFDPDRCGIGFHPLHSWTGILVYCVLLFHPVVRIVGLGLLIHMALDGLDCFWMQMERGI